MNTLYTLKRCFITTAYIFCLSGIALSVGSCDYARMKDDEAINTYQTAMPAKPAHSIPFAGGNEKMQASTPDSLVNPIPADEKSIHRGLEVYTYFCRHCHGPQAKGYGTVGQSFAPLPTNLRSAPVQEQKDGALFHKISRGYKRHPPLAATVAEKDRWHIINYLRFLAEPAADEM